MSQLDSAALEQMISQKRYDEAKEMLRQYFDSELGENEEGEVYVDAMADYLAMSNRINEAYLADMNDLKAKLIQVDDMSEEIKKSIDAEKIRGDIQSLQFSQLVFKKNNRVKYCPVILFMQKVGSTSSIVT